MDDELNRIIDYLRIIERTRLLYNSTEELAEKVGFSLNSGNGLVRMGGKSAFIKKGIFRELAYEVRESTGLDLQEVIELYIQADVFLDKLGKKQKPEVVCHQLISCFYGDAETVEAAARINDKLEARHVPLLVLLLLGILPRISSKKGDVENIGDDYHKVFQLMRETVCNNIPVKVLPALMQMEEIARKHPENMRRIDLISTVNTILNAYGSMSTRIRLIMSNMDMMENSEYPPIEGIWTEDDASTVFWQFEQITNGFFLYHWILNKEKHELRYKRYFIRFIREEEGVWAAVLDPRNIASVISGKPTPNEYIAYLDFEWSDNEMSFDPLNESSKWFRLRGGAGTRIISQVY